MKVNDGTADSNTYDLTVTVNPVNDKPVADPQSVTTNEDTAKPITLTGSDVEAVALNFVIVDPPAYGTLSGDAPTVTYTPDSNYYGADSFSFKVNDGELDSAEATVSITVGGINDPPVANDQSLTTDEDTAKAITLTASDQENDPLTYAVLSGPVHGTLSGSMPNLTYTPDANYYGPDAITFKARDGQADSNVATVIITVISVNDVPLADAQSLNTNEDTPLAITLTGSDIENSSLTYAVTIDPLHGTLSGMAPNITYTPSLNYSGADSFKFRVNDGELDSVEATISITVDAVNDAPVIGGQNTLSTNEDTALTIVFADLMVMDVESAYPTGFSLTVQNGANYTRIDNTVTPVHNFHGTLTVPVQVNDGLADSNIYTLLVTVIDVLPTNADAGGPYNAIAGQPITLNGSATCAAVDTCSYAWDLDGDTVYDDASSASPTLTWNTVGAYTIHLQVTDEDGNSITDTASVTITPTTHSLSLEQGWNLVSFNVRPTSTVIATVLSSLTGNYDLVYAWNAGVASNNWMKYSPTAPGYSNSLNNLDETMGFWIHMTAADTLNVTGSVPVNTNINLSTTGGGWNLVAYPSAVDRPLPEALSDNGVGTDFSLMYAYHANEPADPWKLFGRTTPAWANDLTELAPGWGYWVKVNADHAWSVKYLAD